MNKESEYESAQNEVDREKKERERELINRVVNDTFFYNR